MMLLAWKRSWPQSWLIAPRPGWSDAPIHTEADAIEHIRVTMEAGKKLGFAENERHKESFPHIEAACRELGLGYVVTVSVDEEYDTPGHRNIYDPVTDQVECHNGMDAGTVPAQKVLEMIQDNRIEDAVAFLKHAIAPDAALPQCFTVADGLLSAPAPAM